jgi:HK97 gp10 family phage protein
MPQADGGISRLQARLLAIPQQVRDGIKPAMEKSAQEIVDAMKTLVPVKTGHLRDSIGWTWGDPPKGSVVLGKSSALEGLTITIYAGEGEHDVFYARFVEFGTAHAHAHPFFFPAYRLYKKRAANRIKRAVRTSVRKNWGKP